MDRRRPTRDDVAEGFLRQGTELSLVGRGRSMWPVIRPGDRVVVRRRERRPEPGDIIVVRAPAGLVTHRVVGRLEDPPRVVTRGDWLDRDDRPVDEANVLGFVWRIDKGWITVDLEKPVGALVHKFLFWAGRLLSRPLVRSTARRIQRVLPRASSTQHG